MINIVVTSKPVDGLLYYSYEYCSYLNDRGIAAQVVIICHRKFSRNDYLDSISRKYIHCKNITFEYNNDTSQDFTLVLGRSMITLGWQDFKEYNSVQQLSLRKLFGGKVISVYSENHPTKYPLAIEFFNPERIIDLCDTEVYINGIGSHFEKTINFDIYKSNVNDIQFEYLFLGTNDKYYETVNNIIQDYSDHGILTYAADYVNINNNNIFVPAENLMGMFNTYVYTKNTFDPAPRIFQECKYFNKNVIYQRDKTIRDGGSVYWSRDIKQPDVQPILNAIEKIK